MVGQSFESVLDGIAEKDQQASWTTAFGQTSAGFWTVLSDIGSTADAESGGRPDPQSRYEAEADKIHTAPAASLAQLPPSTDPEAIRRELDLERARSAKDVMQCRRSFARTNHPDLAPPQFREQANLRMQIANRLTDEALAQFAPAGAAHRH
ncbi:hypothetical protein [Aurantimonas sp. VKM B-3413]|uniref:hypothetical protein n=1 Tax=Aurantimonas sp. VKM B-3413 TaxID=2779401 RepID=UPI001E3A2FA3|nr:hypothetical protein [Aurantimonas sp. VKM B-3413]MCB8839132.1 hypothetical protein [Aurantimonas sp. VKM B-3413]